jgi:hypothetical protein
MTVRRNIDLLEITAIRVMGLVCDHNLPVVTCDEKLIKAFNLRSLPPPSVRIVCRGELPR